MDPVIFPESFDSLSDAELTALRDAAVAEGTALSTATTFSHADAERCVELADGVDRINAELGARAEADAALAARREELAARFAPPAAEVTEPVADAAPAEEAPLVASAPVTPPARGARTIVVPPAAAVVANGPTPALPVQDGRTGNAARAIIAAAGVEGFRGGQEIQMRDIVPAMMSRLASYKGVQHAQDLLFQMRMPELPSDLVATRMNFQEVLDRVVDQSRLVNPTTGETGLIAAGGWCAPAPQEYDVCILAGLDGLLDLPTMGMPRGSLSYFRHLALSAVTTQLAAGFDCYTPAELEAEPPLVKPCVEIDCPTPVTAELDACSLCIRAGLLQMKAFPEYVAAWMDLAMIAYARFLNARKINELVAAITADSGAPVVIPATFGAIQAVLNAIRLAAIDLRAFHGMTENRVLEVVLPYWVHELLAVDKSRRQFNSEDAYTLADFRSDLADLNVRVQFVKDWVGQDGGFGSAVPATTWPASVNFLIYPAGAYVEAREEIINVSTLQDTALLTTNRVQLLFVEHATKVIAACGTGRQYTVEICPSGATAGPIATTPGVLVCDDINLLAMTPNDDLDTAGGEAFTLTGTNLQGTTGVTIGGTAATSVVVVNSETVTGVTPAKAAGAYDVVITSPLGTDTIVGGATYV